MELTQLRIRRLELDDSRLLFTLDNGMRVDETIQRHIRLLKASAEQRSEWQTTPDGFGVNWPGLVPPTNAGMINMLELLWDRRLDNALKRLGALQWDMEALTQRDQQLVGIWRLEADMWNGGFMQFFGNWGEETCQYAMQALMAIGAVRTSGIVAGMRGVLDRFENDPNILSLNDVYVAMTSVEQKQLEVLEEAYYEQPDDLARLGLGHYGLERG